MVQYLGEFQPAHGTTSLTPDGGLVFHLEMEPVNRVRAGD
jgi:hypothetical protein